MQASDWSGIFDIYYQTFPQFMTNEFHLLDQIPHQRNSNGICLARYHIKGTVMAITQTRWHPTRCMVNVSIECILKNAEFHTNLD